MLYTAMSFHAMRMMSLDGDLWAPGGPLAGGGAALPAGASLSTYLAPHPDLSTTAAASQVRVAGAHVMRHVLRTREVVRFLCIRRHGSLVDRERMSLTVGLCYQTTHPKNVMDWEKTKGADFQAVLTNFFKGVFPGFCSVGDDGAIQQQLVQRDGGRGGQDLAEQPPSAQTERDASITGVCVCVCVCVCAEGWVGLIWVSGCGAEVGGGGHTVDESAPR